MFCFASYPGEVHFNGCDTNIRSFCPKDEINLLLSGCSCECGLDPA